MKIFYTLILLVCMTLSTQAQSYTSYFTGDTADVNPSPSSGICLMGGATEDDSAMKWFLNKANGGDVVVIRVTGADGYNNYFYTQLGVNINSVETLVIPSVAAANDPYVRKQLRNAEAVWIAGGNQANYINFWNNTSVDTALNDLINVKQGVIGGTSAGMAVQGQAYYSALNNSVTSAATLANPYNSDVTIGYNDFLDNPKMKGIITDTHFDNPDRKGRFVGFIARCVKDYNKHFIGIACDEYTAVCIGSDMLARVYGGHPTYDDNAYFVVPDSCINGGIYQPETCISGQPLTWNHNNQAIRVYAVKGTPNGSNHFDMNTKKTGVGGTWKNWYVNSGNFTEGSLPTPPCAPNGLSEIETESLVKLTPNPASDVILIQVQSQKTNHAYSILDYLGRTIATNIFQGPTCRIDLSFLDEGLYFVQVDGQIQKMIKSK